MTEWGVFGVIVAVVGLLGTVCVPVLRLNTSITRLTVMLDGLQKSVEDERRENRAAHERIWKRVDEQGGAISDHELRLNKLER